VNHFREAVKRTTNPPINEKQLPKEIKRRKNLVFKAVDGEGQSMTIEAEPQSNETMEMESQYIGKTMAELQQILRERNVRLAQLEEQNFNLLHNEGNMSYVQKQIQELDRETDKLREKNGHLETEQRLLYEDLMSKKDQLNELELALAKAPQTNATDAAAKKDIIERIEKNTKYIDDLNKKLASYENGNSKEMEDIKKNSEKNMLMELEEIKINVMNYDEELLKWMRYYEAKVGTSASAQVIEQSIF